MSRDPITTAQKPQRHAASIASEPSPQPAALLLKQPAPPPPPHALHASCSPPPPFLVSLTSAAAAAQHAQALTFLREASALLAELGALLPWARALDVAPAAAAALAGAAAAAAGPNGLEPALLAVSRVAFVAEAYLQRAFAPAAAAGAAPPAPARLAAALPASAPALVARLGALVAQQHASLATILKYRAEFAARVAAMGEAGVRAAGLGSCVALLAELQGTRAVPVALVRSGGGGGSSVGGALEAALAVAPWDPSLALALAGAVAAGSAGSAEPDVLMLATRQEGAQARTLRVLRLTLAAHEGEGEGGSSGSGSGSGSRWEPAPLYMALNRELPGRRPEASALAFSSLVAVTLPLSAKGMPIRAACILVV
jgi:hypothetical protein